MDSDEVLLVTTDHIPGYRIVKVLGLASGSVVMARNLGRDVLAALRNLAGGEIKEYTELMARARDIALRRLCEKARSVGANAVIGLRITSSTVMSGAAEILAYGTAVIVEPVGEVEAES